MSSNLVFPNRYIIGYKYWRDNFNDADDDNEYINFYYWYFRVYRICERYHIGY